MELNKKCLFLSFVLMSGCASTQYHEPMTLSDEEVESMVIHDRFTDNGSASPGRIRACSSIFSNEQGCAIILCHKDESRKNNLRCDLYAPKSRNK